jgi:hypothetical protein
MVTPLSVCLANATSTTLITAKQLYAGVGVANSGYPYTETKIGAGVTGYGQIWAAGTSNNWAAAGSLPAEDGHGFILESAVLNLAGKRFVAGNWAPTVRLTSCSSPGLPGGTINCATIVRYSVYRAAGSYDTIVTDIYTGRLIDNTPTTIALPAAAGILASLGAGDVLYIGLWLNVTSMNGGATYVRLNRLSTDTINKTGDPNAKHVTPGYETSTSSNRTVPADAALSATTNITRYIPAAAALVVGNQRVMPSSAALTLLPTAHWTPASSTVTLDAVTGARLLLYNGASARDMTVSASFQVAEDCGLVARYTDSTHFYLLRYSDSERGVYGLSRYGAGRYGMVSYSDGAVGTITIELYNGGAPTILAATTASISRDKPHLVIFTVVRDLLTGYLDGERVIQVADSAMISPGQAGYRYSGASSTLYSFRVEAQGADLEDAPLTVLSKVTLSSDNPMRSPALHSLRVEARDRSLASGALVPDTNYGKQKNAAAILDDVSTLSQCSWRIREGALSFGEAPNGRLLPWLLSSETLLAMSPPQLVRQSPGYRNRHIILSANDTIAMEEERMGDGVRRSWTMTYALDEEPTILLDGTDMSVGIKDEQTGCDFYWTRGSRDIWQDKDGLLLSFANTLDITYVGQTTSDVMAESVEQQQALAALSETSGIVEVVEKANGLSVASAQARADAMIERYARLARAFTCETEHAGAEAGMLAYVFVPEHGITDGSFYLTEVKRTVYEQADGTLRHRYGLKVVEGPNIGNFSKFFVPVT